MIGLKYLCIINNIRYQELANKIGIGKATVSNWVVGRKNISYKHYEKLKEIFKVLEEYFGKELTEIDKFKLQRIQLENDIV